MPLYYDFKVTLHGSSPKIWRRFLLHPDATFEDLHDAIQDSFGWHSAHLWHFGTDAWGGTKLAASGIMPGEEPVARDTRLSEFFEDNQRCVYVYDYGDEWQHDVLRYKRRVELDDVFWRRLQGGEEPGPPEDCGGLWGYYELVDLLEAPGDQLDEWEREQLEWLASSGWSPRFDLDAQRGRFDRDTRDDPEPSFIEIDPKLARVLEVLAESMPAFGCTEDQIQTAQSAWIDYIRRAQPKPRKPEILAAAHHYTLTLLLPDTFSQRSQSEFAKLYGTSVASISKAYTPIYDELAASIEEQLEQHAHHAPDSASVLEMISIFGDDEMSSAEMLAFFGMEDALEQIQVRPHVVLEVGLVDDSRVPGTSLIVGLTRTDQEMLFLLPTTSGLGVMGVFAALMFCLDQNEYIPGKIVFDDATVGPRIGDRLDILGVKILDEPTRVFDAALVSALLD